MDIFLLNGGVTVELITQLICMKEMNLLISIDDKYVDLAIDMLYSIKLHNEEFLNVYLIYSKMEEESINKISNFLKNNNIGKLIPIWFDFSKVQFPMNIDYISVVTYYRLFAPFIIKDNIDRLLYLDCDIICTSSIKELYNMNFEDNIIIGCKNQLKNRLKVWNERVHKNLDIDMKYEYINAGVLLINILEYKKFTSIENILNFINSNYDRLIFQDQDVINKMFFDKIKIADQKYNYQINAVDDGNEIYNNCLVHYSEKFKPWNFDYDNLQKAIPYYKFLKSKGEFDKLNKIIHFHAKNYANLLYNQVIKDFEF